MPRQTATASDGELTKRNVQAVAELEHAALQKSSTADLISDRIAGFAATGKFLVIHAVWFTAWILVNIEAIPGVEPFDAFPFSLLTTIVSLEAIFLAIFVLINQTRLTRQADRRAQLDLQINLLAEEEMTIVSRMLESLCEKAGIETYKQNPELREAVRKTDLQGLMSELDETLPDPPRNKGK